MRRDKLLVDIGGEALLLRNHTWLKLHFDVVVVAVDGRRDALPGALTRWPDGAPGSGPLPVVCAALDRWGEALFVCAADQLGSPDEAWQRLRAAWSSSASAAALESAAGPEPLFAIYGPALLPRLSAGRNDVHCSLRDVLSSSPDVLRIPAPPAWCESLNRPQDLQAQRGAARHE